MITIQSFWWACWKLKTRVLWKFLVGMLKIKNMGIMDINE